MYKGITLMLVTAMFCSLLMGCAQGNPSNDANTQHATDVTDKENVTETVNEKNMVEDVWLEKSKTDVRYASAVAFLQRDIETLCAMNGEGNTKNDPIDKIFTELETVVFGECSIEEQPDSDKLRFCFAITDSDCSYFPVGQYEYDISYGGPAGAVSWSDITTAECPEAVSLFDMLATVYTKYTFAYTDNIENGICEEAVFFDILTLYIDDYEAFTVPVDYMQTAAYDLFGLTDYTPPKNVASLGDEGYSSLVFGGLVMKCDLIHVETKEDSLCFEYQLYADACGIVRSHTVEITFAVSDNKYGYTFSSAKIIQPGNYAPFGYHV